MAMMENYKDAYFMRHNFDHLSVEEAVKAISGYSIEDIFWRYLGTHIRYAGVNTLESMREWFAREHSESELTTTLYYLVDELM